MKRSLCVLAVGVFLKSAVTLALGFWIQGGLQHAVAQGDPPGATISGDVNGDGRLNIADAVYILNNRFYGGPAPVPIVCPPAGLPATGQTKC